ncbi:MAG: class I SAM-dependent methyltransferase [Verrucomicrobiota bacterium]|nr:class I SAM-dependent methyltransferase [Verrucomicrobiota bacterium]
MNSTGAGLIELDDSFDDPEPFSIEDEKFDQAFRPRIRRLSSLFWTPVAIAAKAAELLVPAPGTRVLDIGSGPGKFCLIGATLTEGHFTGVEQRLELVAAAREAARALGVSNVEFVHANVTEIHFAEYDSFYLFNPFEENLLGHKIDSAIPLTAQLFKKYTRHVAAQLGARPIGTRVVTYAGYADEVPSCYECEAAHFDDDLKLWIKRREFDPALERLGLRASRSYRGSNGWARGRTGS